MFRFITIIGLFFSATIAGWAIEQNSLHVTLKSEAKVEGFNFRLVDIVSVNSSDELYLNQLNDLIIGSVPRAGYKKTVTRKEVEKVIKRVINMRTDKIKIDGAEQVIVSLSAKTIPVEHYLKLAENSLYEYMSHSHTNIILDPVGVYKPIYVPVTADKINVSIPDSTCARKRMNVMVEIYSNNKLYTKLPVWFSVKAKAIVYKLKREVSSGMIVTEDMLEAEILDISEAPDSIVSDKSKIIGKQIVSEQKENSVIVGDYLQDPLDVVAGQEVTVKMSSGAIMLQTKAVAIESGSAGKMIKLRNISSREIFTGRIISKNVVECIL